jgi:ubiquinone/menaquinone biosynthesis C-methylase UbiE
MEGNAMASTLPAPVNYWPDTACAKAFWGQHELPPYRKLLADTADWLDPQPLDHWLDLGCGCGQLTKTLWEKSHGRIAEIAALDCAATNEHVIAKLRATLRPPANDRIRFVLADFSNGLATWEDEFFDGVVSGLAIQYAECFSHEQGRWTPDAYDHLLREVYRVLRVGGRFVFSVNVPEPAWGKVGLHALSGVFQSPRPGRYLKNMLRMYRYGRWLTREARRGRFHYLPAEEVAAHLQAAGFTDVQNRLTYCDQAILFRCLK